MTTEGQTDQEETYPAVRQAFDFVLASYQWALQRIEAVEGGLQSLQAIAASVALGAPVIAKAFVDAPDFNSPWFYLALAAFAVIVIVGGIARTFGTLRLLGVQNLYDKWLHLSEWQFKKDVLYYAAQHQRRNTFLVNLRGYSADALTIVLAAEVFFFVMWFRALF